MGVTGRDHRCPTYQGERADIYLAEEANFERYVNSSRRYLFNFLFFPQPLHACPGSVLWTPANRTVEPRPLRVCLWIEFSLALRHASFKEKHTILHEGLPPFI